VDHLRRAHSPNGLADQRYVPETVEFNIVAQESVVPELLNEAVTPERIAEEALKVLRDPARREAVRARLHRVHESLGAPGVLKRIAGDMARTLELPAGRPNETASC